MEITRPKLTTTNYVPLPNATTNIIHSADHDLLDELYNLPLPPTRNLNNVSSTNSSIPSTSIPPNEQSNNDFIRSVINENQFNIINELIEPTQQMNIQSPKHDNINVADDNKSDAISTSTSQVSSNASAISSSLPGVAPPTQSDLLISQHMNQQLNMFIRKPSNSSFDQSIQPVSVGINDSISEPTSVIVAPPISTELQPNAIPAPTTSRVASVDSDAPPSYQSIMNADQISSIHSVSSPQHTLHSLFKSHQQPKYQLHELPSVTEYPHVRLLYTPQQRAVHDSAADMYALVVAMEHLELAYVRDTISSTIYTQQCIKLINQYKLLVSAVNDTNDIGTMEFNIDQFMTQHNLNCKHAANRLKSGVPATNSLDQKK